MLALADLSKMTENKVKAHIAQHYSGEPESYSRTEQQVAELSEKLKNLDVLVAYESVGDYGCDSSSWFLFRDRDTHEFYTIHGSHCSCYGFEGQGQLELADIAYLKSKKFHFSSGGYDEDSVLHKAAVKAFLELLT